MFDKVYLIDEIRLSNNNRCLLLLRHFHLNLVEFLDFTSSLSNE